MTVGSTATKGSGKVTGLDSILSVFGEFIQLIFSWLPRPFLVNVTERAVLFRRGQDPILKGPGFRWHTPLFSDYEMYSILKDAAEFEPVVLPTKDGKPVAIGFCIVWHLEHEDVITAATTTDDLEAMIGEIGESLLPPLILGYTLDELLERVRGDRGMKTVNKSLSEEAQALLTPFGVTVDYARINFLSPTRVFKLIT
jgi:regulator of protease activity HflC (stomatin/prohibitin superfamily)